MGGVCGIILLGHDFIEANLAITSQIALCVPRYFLDEILTPI